MRRILLFALWPAALYACGRDNALVDGDCAPGLVLVGNMCVPAQDVNVDVLGSDAEGGTDGQSGDATNADRVLGDSPNGDGQTGDTSTDAFSCDDGLTYCSGMCVDTTSDPLNCGGCGIICPSLLCSASKCVGGVPGSLIVIGHDYEGTYSAAQQRVLTNSLLVSTATAMRVRSYEQYASPTAVANVKSILNAAASGAGRSITYTIATAPSDVTPGMTALNTDVLVIYDQVSAPASTLAGVGSGWATTISNFTQVGGVVIVLDGQGGTSPQMPDLLTNAGILAVSADNAVKQSTPLDVVAPADAVGLGVVSPYGAGKHSVFFTTTEPDTSPVTYVVEDPDNDAGPTQPVVVHKVAP